MNLRYLHYLRLVVEHGGFGAAARAAGVSQPAVSHAMQVLERDLGTPLFTRAGRNRQPTEAALRIARQAAAVQQQIGELAPAHKTPRSRATADVLRAGVCAAAGLLYGPALHAAWCAGHPQRRLEMVSADEGTLLSGLKAGVFDLAIAPLPRGYTTAGLQTHWLYMSTPQVYARSGHPLASARSLEDLREAQWAIAGPSVSGPVHVLMEAHAVRHLPLPRIAVSCPDYPSLVQAVAHTDLLCVIPEAPLLGSALRDKALVPLKLRETLPRYDVQLFTRNPAARAVSAAAAVVAAHAGATMPR